MRINYSLMLFAGVLAMSPTAFGTDRIVTTTSPTGAGSLTEAIAALQDGDTIKFDITGAGPHYIQTPPDGYPEITNNNVTIDGYSQPGAVPNTNPINAPNNAQIKIVIDGRAGGKHTWDISGYGTTESGQFVVSGNSINIRGLSFLGIYGEDSDLSPKRYVIALGNRGGYDAHINGCWLGVAPDGTTVSGFADGITGFRHRTPSDVLVDRVVVGVKADSTDPRAEFNVMVDLCIPIIIEGSATRISGNFIGVLPDGLTRVPNPITPAGYGWEGYIELARDPNNIVIGTDGDGVNDADEGNYFGGGVHRSFSAVTTEGTYDHLIEMYGGGVRTNIIIAGNHIGVGVDGTTYFTNVDRFIDNWGNGAQVQIGSDFDGVSDSLEANVIANNHPFNDFYADLNYYSPPAFIGLDAGEIVSVRGNVLINNNLAPYTYADRAGTIPGFTPYAAPFMDTTSTTALPLPELDTNSVYPSLKGTFPVGTNSYTNIIVDVYQLDLEGWTNGIAIAGAQFWPNLSDYVSYTNGFPQGSKYLGSFPVANTGSFDVNVASLDLGSGTVTATVNYSADPPGTHRGLTHTGDFANPVTLEVPPTLTITGDGSSLTISWSRGTLLQSDTLGDGASWSPVPGASAPSYTFTPGTGNKFYRAQVQ